MFRHCRILQGTYAKISLKHAAVNNLQYTYFYFGVNRAVPLKFVYFLFPCGAAAQRGPWPPQFLRFLDHTQRRITGGRTTLDE